MAYYRAKIDKGLHSLYGFYISDKESDPDKKVTYLSDCGNAGFTPFHVDLATGKPNYGSWSGLEFFFPRPCMLKSDGTVDYYLDPNDYTKKEDGTPSDVANTAYDGNAMMEWGKGTATNGEKIWTKIIPVANEPAGGVHSIADAMAARAESGNSAAVLISKTQLDEDFTCWPFYDMNDRQIPHFYTSIYESSNVSGKLRSLSGRTPLYSTNGNTEIAYARANNKIAQNVIWNIGVFADRNLIDMLVILLCKSTNSQAKLGNGYVGQSWVNSFKGINTGTMDKNGLFYGYQDFSKGVKVFGMENWYGNLWKRCLGASVNNGKQLIKLTYGTADGSAVRDYSEAGQGYLDTKIVFSAATAYIKTMNFSKNAMVPVSSGGSETTYYTDNYAFSTDGRTIRYGGGWSHQTQAGELAMDATTAYVAQAVNGGTNLSCKPLAQ